MYIIPYLSFIFCNIRKIMRKGTSDTLSPLDFAPIRIRGWAQNDRLREKGRAIMHALVPLPIYLTGFKCFNDKSRMGALCVSAPDEI